MASNVATADSAASSTSAVKSEVSSAIVEEMKALEASLGAVQAAKLAQRAPPTERAHLPQARATDEREQAARDGAHGLVC